MQCLIVSYSIWQTN